MKLIIRDGKLSFGSIYKLFVVSWSTTWIAFAGFVIAIILLGTLITGETMMNGETVEGRIPALLALAPMIILFPVVIFLQSFIFAAFLTGGVWLYSRKRPIDVVIE